MVHKLMNFKSADNSGAKYLQCIDTYSKFNTNYNKQGNFIKVIVKHLDYTKKIKKKKKYLGLAITSKTLLTRKDGSQLKSDNKKMLIFNENYKFMGTRIHGFISKESIYTENILSKLPKVVKYPNRLL